MRVSISIMTWNSFSKEHKKKGKLSEIFKEVSMTGYEGVEIGGNEDNLGSPESLKKLLKKYNLEIAGFATSVTYNPYKPNTLAYRKSMRYASKIGAKLMMICGGFLPNQRRNTYSFDYDMFAENLYKAILFAKELGLNCAYHPHRGCIVETIKETKEMIKRIPELQLCPDIAHLEAVGEDAVKFIKKFKKRIIYIHLKDYSWKKDVFTELGKGDSKLDVSECVKELQRIGYNGWLTVELDKTFRTPYESAKISRRYLKKYCNI